MARPKLDLQTLSSNGEGMRLRDSVSVSHVAKFLVRVAVEDMFSKSAVVVRYSVSSQKLRNVPFVALQVFEHRFPTSFSLACLASGCFLPLAQRLYSTTPIIRLRCIIGSPWCALELAMHLQTISVIACKCST
jgi:hypothetical protein